MPTRIKKQKLNLTRIIFLSLFLYLSIVGITYYIRSQSFEKTFPTTDAYYNYRISKQTTNLGEIMDLKITPERKTNIEVFHIIIKFTTIFIPFFTTIIPFLLGILNIIIISLVINEFLKLYKIKKKISILIFNLLFISSPYLIFQSFSFSPFLFNILLINLILFFILKYNKKNNPWYFFLSIISSIVLAITTLQKFISITILLILFYFTLKDKINNKILVSSLFVGIITNLGINYKTLISFDIINLFRSQLINNLFLVELGAKVGIRIIDLILVILGIGILWTNKKKYYISSIILFFLIIFSLRNSYLNNIIYPIYSLLGTYSIISLIKRDWEIIYLKKLTFSLIITFYLIFSTQYVISLSNSEPTTQKFEALEWLEKNSNNSGFVFSSIENGFLIQTISNKTVFIDENLDNSEINKLEEYEKILYNRDINFLIEKINKYNLSFFIIDEEMKYDFWNNKINGLYFIIQNSEIFEQIYNKNGIEIYQIKLLS